MSELEHRVTAHEIMEWRAFEHIFGPITIQERIDVHAGATSGVMPQWDKNNRPGDDEDDEDLAPRVETEQSPTEMMAIVRGLKGS